MRGSRYSKKQIMTIDEGARLRAYWIAGAKAPCEHPALTLEEASQGQLTGMFICMDCGELIKRRYYLRSYSIPTFEVKKTSGFRA